MQQHEFTTSVNRDQLTFFYDTRTRNLSAIEEFFASPVAEKLKQSIHERAYIVLGGDGLFVHVAKMAHRDDAAIFGINFGTKGFLLHDRWVFDRDVLDFEPRLYPILHADVHVGDEHFHGHAFNEVYATRAGDASSVKLSISHRTKIIESYIGDGIMISTPAGSTGWSRSYGGVLLPHDTNLNAITPIGKMSPREFTPMPLPDKWRIRIKNDTSREAPIDILLDNRRIVSMETRPFELVIERAEKGVRLLIERSYRDTWDAKIYAEQGMSTI